MRIFESKLDFYTQKAKEEGYAARSVYKLQEIDQKFQVFKIEDKVLDLGCSPGSWLQYLSKVVGKTGRIVGIDIEDLMVSLPASNASGVANAGWPNNAIFVKKDVLAEDFFELDCLQERYNAVISDLAPHTSGMKDKDVAGSLELGERALEIAKKALIEGGWLVCKVFEGAGVDDFVKKVEQYFEVVKRFKPKAIKKGSREFYMVAKGYKKLGLC